MMFLNLDTEEVHSAFPHKYIYFILYWNNPSTLFAPNFVNYKKGALDSQPQVIQFTSCLHRVGGSLRVLRLPPPLKLVAMI